MLVTDEQLFNALELFRNENQPTHSDGFYRVALTNGVKLAEHECSDIELFGALKVRVFPVGSLWEKQWAWQQGYEYEPQKQEPVVAKQCPNCGATVVHPKTYITATGTIDLCDCCGFALGDEEPMAGLSIMKSLGVRTDTPDQAGK